MFSDLLSAEAAEAIGEVAGAVIAIAALMMPVGPVKWASAKILSMVNGK